MEEELFCKYDKPAPRYTSYPTVPSWERTPSESEWLDSVRHDLSQASSTWGAYVHLPFCESLCRYCGCNNIITKDHMKEIGYLKTLLAELEIYKRNVAQLKNSPLRQIHLGGGTPTFFSADRLRELVTAILSAASVKTDDFEGSVEIDPRRTTEEQLRTLHDLGFNRISLGVQDLDPQVQKALNRIQPIELVSKITKAARDTGYKSVNYDLIYGLPLQSLVSITSTIHSVLDLAPDRIALYGFAYVPWLKPHHKALGQNYTIPEGGFKRTLYERAREELVAAGYVEIGMDHFSKPDEALALALQNGKLHRNFMGYTDVKSDVLLALGMSGISENSSCFIQNSKDINDYKMAIQSGRLAIEKGHVLTEQDRVRRQQILELMTRYRVKFLNKEEESLAREQLNDMQADGLVKIRDGELMITTKGRPFLRNACTFFDERMKNKDHSTTENKFSKSI